MTDGEIELPNGRAIPVYGLPAGADYIMDEPTEEDRAPVINWGVSDHPMRVASDEAYARWMAMKDAAGQQIADHERAFVQRLMANPTTADLMADHFAAREEPIRRRVEERAKIFEKSWKYVFDRAFTIAGIRVATDDRRLVRDLSTAVSDAAVQKVGTAEVTQVEIAPGAWRTTIETDGMTYEIEVRGEPK